MVKKKNHNCIMHSGCLISLVLTTGIRSYLVGIIDSFVNKFGVLFLIPIQAIIFGWIYGLDDIIPILNENSSIKVGKLWVVIIKYIAPVILFVLWFIGIIGLFKDASMFELAIDMIVMVSVLVVSYIFTNKKSSNG
nr:hypothetical protein [uncultured Methanobrevibacter sp.]